MNARPIHRATPATLVRLCEHHECRCARAAELAEEGRTREAVAIHEALVRCRREVAP